MPRAPPFTSFLLFQPYTQLDCNLGVREPQTCVLATLTCWWSVRVTPTVTSAHFLQPHNLALHWLPVEESNIAQSRLLGRGAQVAGLKFLLFLLLLTSAIFFFSSSYGFSAKCVLFSLLLTVLICYIAYTLCRTAQGWFPYRQTSIQLFKNFFTKSKIHLRFQNASLDTIKARWIQPTLL